MSDTVWIEDEVREAAESCLDLALVTEYGGAMAGARSITGRRPAQAAFRARLAYPYSLGRYGMDAPEPEPDHEILVRSGDGEWEPLGGAKGHIVPSTLERAILALVGEKEVVAV